MNIGMTKAIATQAAKDEIAKVGTGVDNVARTGVQEVKSQLDDIVYKNKNSFINLVDYKHLVSGDDWTLAIEECFRESINNNGVKIILPPNDLVISRPIKIEYTENTPSFILEGSGSVASGILGKFGTRIIGKNITDKRGIFEFLGDNNSKITSISVENIEIKLDYTTCAPLSFCMKIGDGFAYSFRKVKFSGFNSLMIRNGSSPSAQTYATMCCKFDQVTFLTNRYIGWDGTTIDTKNKYGFAIAFERFFEHNSYSAFMMDNVTFDTCFFGGLVTSYITSAQYNNCMWYIPGGYKPTINPLTDNNFNANFISTPFNCGMGIFACGGNITLINPYFEDVGECIYSKSLGGRDVSNLIINNPTFIATLNTKPIINGVEQKAKYGIKADECGVNSSLFIKGGTYSEGNSGFQDGLIVNNGFRNLEVDCLQRSTYENIKDSKSNKRHISFTYSNNISTNIVEFRGKTKDFNLLKISGIVPKLKCDKNYMISKVEILVAKILTEKHNLFIKDQNEDIKIKIEYGVNYDSNKIDLYQSGTTQHFIIDKIPFKDFEGSQFQRRYDTTKGDLLSISSSPHSGVNSVDDADIVVRLHLES